MRRFRYVAYNDAGARINAELDAIDLNDARRRMRADNLTPIRIDEAARVDGGGRSDRVRLAEVEFLVSELALLLGSGVRIDRAMQILERGAEAPGLRRLVESIGAGLRAGKTVAEAFAAHPKHFDALFVNLVRLGESTGTLPSVFEALASNLRFRRQINARILQAMAYPAFIAGVCVIVLLIVFNFIVPRLSLMFEGVEDLPLYTTALLAVSDLVSSYQWYLLAVLVGGGAAAWYGLRRIGRHPGLDRALVNTPLIGRTVRVLERLRHATAMALLLAEGVVLDEALRLAAGSVRNHGIHSRIVSAREAVKRGAPLHRSLAETDLYPPALVGLVEVGEESGNLPRIFDDIAKRTRDEFEGWVTRVTTYLEPALILFMGLVVGSIVVVMLLSIVSVQDVSF